MSSNSTTLSRAIALALALGAGGMGVAQAQSDAQEQQAAQSHVTLEGIQVTGSRIRQTDIETEQPVLTITRADIEEQGFESIGDILQNISAMGSAPLTRASPNSAGQSSGGTFLSLRGLGPERTLVLVNGQRMGIGLNGRADLSMIPTAAIERVEVLKDGASSIYGSDAIAGVVNIITRTNFDGAGLTAYYGQYSEGDGETRRGDMLMGMSGDRGSMTFVAEWGDEKKVNAFDREFSRYPRSHHHPTDGWSTTSTEGGFFSRAADGLPNVNYSGNTRVMVREGGDPRNPADYINQDLNTGSCAPNSLAAPGPGTCTPGSTAGKFNPQSQMHLRTPREWRSLYMDGVLNLTDSVRFRTNMLYSNRSGTRMTSGRPARGESYDAPMSADSYYNPLGREIDRWWRRTEEIPRERTNDLTTYRLSSALEGDFMVGTRFFDWDVSYMYNENRLLISGWGDMTVDHLRNSVGPSFLDPDSGKVMCGVPGSPIEGCVPFNPFVPYGVAGSGGLTGNSALQDYLFHEEQDTLKATTEVMSANISGSVYTLPAGDVGVAVGAEHRRESGSFVPDALSISGGSTNLGSSPTDGSYSVREMYAEAQVPLLADMPFAEELTLNVASRYSDYNSFGDTTNNKMGLRWRPTGSVLFRGTVADGFRAPTISDLYRGLAETGASYTDPCDVVFGSSSNNATTRANCAQDLGSMADTFRQLTTAGTPITSPNSSSAVRFLTGSNPALSPEQSRSKTLGVVWSPSFLEGFNGSLDWWKVRITDTIVTDRPGSMLEDCYVRGITSRCGFSGGNGFTRDPVTGNIDGLTFGKTNAGFREVEGYDLDLSYRFSTEQYGNFGVSSSSTYMIHDKGTNSHLPQLALSDTGFGGNFRLRSNLRAAWDKGIFGASWSTRYYSSMKESCRYYTPSPSGVPPVMVPHLECNEITYAPTGVINDDGSLGSEVSYRRRVGSTMFHDVQFRVEAPWNATVSVGANNVFGHTGPVMYSQPGSNSSNYGGFDIGRFVYVRYKQRF